MSPRLALLALALVVAGCTDRTGPEPPGRAPSPPPPGVHQGGASAARDARERVARQLARALANAEFRHQVKNALDRSPIREHKLHLQRWLDASDRHTLRSVAQANGISEAALATEARSAAALEMYLPVPAHRAAWRGDDNLLVATVGADHEAPWPSRWTAAASSSTRNDRPPPRSSSSSRWKPTLITRRAARRRRTS